MNISSPFKKILRLRLRSQLIIGIVVILMTTISLFVVDLINRQRAFFLKLNHDRGIGIAENLAKIAVLHVASHELDGLETLLESYRNLPGLEYAMIISPDGIVLSHTNEAYIGLKPTDSISVKLKPTNSTQVLFENNYTLDIASPIINKEGIIGWARVGLSQKIIEPNIAEIKKRGIIYIFISLIVGIMFALIASGLLSEGLHKLVLAAKKIKEGNRDLRVLPTNSIEVTQLGIAINQMLDDISANEKLLSMVLENMPVGVFILDAEGKVISANSAAKEIWEGAPFVRKGEYNIYKARFPDTGKEIESDEWGAAIALNENRAVLNQEVEIEGFKGKRKTILNSCIPLHDTNSRITGLIAINVDITDRKLAEIELRKINHAIGERVKELRCLYKMSQLSNDFTRTIQDVLLACVDIIPPSYQYPEITCARIEFEGQIFESADFAESIWKQEQTIFIKEKKVGSVQVYYKEKMPEESEGPFLSEERLLINSIADILSSSAERKKAEIELEKSEERHRALIENISDGIVLINKDSEIIYQSPSVKRIVGYSIEDRKNKSAFDFVHPDDVHLSIDTFDKAKKNPGVAVERQYRTKHKNGNYIWIEVSVMNLLDNKSVGAMVVIYRDITERKKQEEQQKLFMSIVNSSDDGIISKTLDGTITSWNHGAEKILGYHKEEIIGQKISKLIPKELIKEENDILSRISEGISIDHFETKRLNKKGELIDVSLTISPIFDSSGKIVAASKIIRNITEQKRAEEKIRQSESNYRQLFDLSPAPMWVIDNTTSRFIQVNKACINNYGYSEEEFKKMTLLDISPNEKIPDGPKQTNSSFIQGSRHKKKSGELIDIEVSSIPLILNGEKKILMVAIDVTEKNLYEQKLTKAAIKAQEDERYEIGGELHDNVCQILATSQIFLGMIKKSLAPESDALYERTLNYIILASDEIRKLSHRLAPAFFDDATLGDAFNSLLANFNSENKYQIILNFDKRSLEYSLPRDLQLNLYRILQEQLRNISKHAKATKIKVAVSINNDILQMLIEDNGVGFDMKSGKGGIGLANMNRRVQLFSGNFVIDSSIGNGCEIMVEIDLKMVAHNATGID
jgi:PAS domain S-box-containing protein